jgi:hypothetical protein
MHNIKLSKKNYPSEKLDISPYRTVVYTDIDPEITWNIDASRKIHSFRIESKHANNPFDRQIPEEFGTTLTLKVCGSPSLDWWYTIHWKDEKDKTVIHHDDPKIPINPTKFDPVPIIIAVLSSLFGLLSLKFLFNKLRK